MTYERPFFRTSQFGSEPFLVSFINMFSEQSAAVLGQAHLQMTCVPYHVSTFMCYAEYEPVTAPFDRLR
jgi:hypothetical protein